MLTEIFVIITIGLSDILDHDEWVPCSIASLTSQAIYKQTLLYREIDDHRNNSLNNKININLTSGL